MSDTCPYCGDGPESIGTNYHIECVEKLTKRIAELQDKNQRLFVSLKGNGVRQRLYWALREIDDAIAAGADDE